MSSYASAMKAQIVADLTTLVPASLGVVIQDDFSKMHPLDRDFAAFPAAVVIPPMVSASNYEDQGHNLREYTFYIMLVFRPEDVQSSTTYVEDLLDAVLNLFDNDCTLAGTAEGAVLPAVIEPPGAVVAPNSVTYGTAFLSLKAKALVTAKA